MIANLYNFGQVTNAMHNVTYKYRQKLVMSSEASSVYFGDTTGADWFDTVVAIRGIAEKITAEFKKGTSR